MLSLEGGLIRATPRSFDKRLPYIVLDVIYYIAILWQQPLRYTKVGTSLGIG